MAKEQFNMRLEGELIQKIHEIARQRGISATELITNAISAELGVLPEPEPLPMSAEEIKQLISVECSGLAEFFNNKIKELEDKHQLRLQEAEALINSNKTKLLHYVGKMETSLLAEISELEEAMQKQEKAKGNGQVKPPKPNDESKPKVLRQSQLADRLNIDEKTIAKHKLDKDFIHWSKNLDPEGIAWRLERGKFVPVEPPEAFAERQEEAIVYQGVTV